MICSLSLIYSINIFRKIKQYLKQKISFNYICQLSKKHFDTIIILWTKISYPLSIYNIYFDNLLSCITVISYNNNLNIKLERFKWPRINMVELQQITLIAWKGTKIFSMLKKHILWPLIHDHYQKEKHSLNKVQNYQIKNPLSLKKITLRSKNQKRRRESTHLMENRRHRDMIILSTKSMTLLQDRIRSLTLFSLKDQKIRKLAQW